MLANLLYNRSKFAKSTPTEISSTETNPDAQRDTNENNRQDTSFLIKKNGYITEKRKDMVTVSVEKDIIRFSLKDVDCDYKPKKFDRITLYCEPQDEGSISDEDVSPLVRKIGIARAKKFTGRVTSVEQNGMGIIDESCIFFWDALASDYNVVTENDLVEADCVQCEFDDDNKYRWRCLNVKFLGEDENLTKKVNNLSMTGITANKHGIEVEDNVVVKLSDLDDTINFTMTVKNTSNDAVECLGGMLLRQGNKLHSQLQLISPTRRQHILLKPGAELKYSFKATSKMYGEASEQFVIKFKSVSIVESFTILRFIRVIVHDSEGKHRTIGTGVNVMQNYAYTHSVLTRNHPAVIPGLPPAASPKFVCVRFENWQVPQKIADVLINSSRAVIYEELAIGFQHLQIDNRSLSISNYSEVFHDLLYLEEFAMNHNIRKYDKRARFIRENGYLAVEIQDVAETRPSLVVGDFVLAIDLKSETNKIPWKGYIYEVKQNHILLKFNEGFHPKNQKYQLTFHFSRKTLRKQHHAIELGIKKLPSILFPDNVIDIEKQVDVTLNLDDGDLECGSSILAWFNPSLNVEQKQAVTNILQGVARPTPYIIFGPPGTGKTVTLIEVILQLIRNVPKSRLLVATPSNSSANLLTERIIDSHLLKGDQFVRLVSYINVQRGTISPKVLSQCGIVDISLGGTRRSVNSELETNIFNAKKIMSRQLVIGTCITLGSLMQCELPEDHFTHVIVDESGQCTETESMIPLQFVDKDIGQVILAGDPLQLGPIVLSSIAVRLGLSKSLLTRLLERPLYQQDIERFQHGYDPRLVTKLVKNYRSLPRVMQVYNKLFYDNDLVGMLNGVDSEEAKILRKLSPVLPNHGARHNTEGVCFIGVKGENLKCSESPSWYNMEEAKSVSVFYSKLIKIGLDVDDIGIITPYVQQVRTIRSIILKSIVGTDIRLPKIGTVEEFQGQERKVILVSTVRTMEKELCKDKRYSLGFIKCAKRMNVAISRARAALVIFGSPKLLSLDENWKALIEHCQKNKCSTNCDNSHMSDHE